MDYTVYGIVIYFPNRRPGRSPDTPAFGQHHVEGDSIRLALRDSVTKNAFLVDRNVRIRFEDGIPDLRVDQLTKAQVGN